MVHFGAMTPQQGKAHTKSANKALRATDNQKHDQQLKTRA